MNTTERKKRFHVPAAILLSLAMVLGSAAQPAAAWTTKTLCGPSSNEWMDQEWVCRHTHVVPFDSRIQLDIRVMKSETSTRWGQPSPRPVELQLVKVTRNGVRTVLSTTQRNPRDWWVAPTFSFNKGDSLIIIGTMLGDLRANNDIILYVEKSATVTIRR